MATLVSKDDVEVQISEKSMNQCHLFIDMKDSLTNMDKIPLPEVDGEILKLIIEYLKMYDDAESYTPAENYKAQISSKDKEFMEKIPHDKIVPFLNAANYLNIPRLTDAGLLYIRGWVYGRSPEEIRYILDLPDDYTSEEKHQMANDFTFYNPNDAQRN